MGFMKKWNRVLGSSMKRLLSHSKESGSGGSRYEKLTEKKKKGCIMVYVGQEKERFEIKIETLKHPLFKKLLDAAEKEFGNGIHGPLCLPCDVDFFRQALPEMETHRHA